MKTENVLCWLQVENKQQQQKNISKKLNNFLSEKEKDRELCPFKEAINVKNKFKNIYITGKTCTDVSLQNFNLKNQHTSKEYFP